MMSCITIALHTASVQHERWSRGGATQNGECVAGPSGAGWGSKHDPRQPGSGAPASSTMNSSRPPALGQSALHQRPGDKMRKSRPLGAALPLRLQNWLRGRDLTPFRIEPRPTHDQSAENDTAQKSDLALSFRFRFLGTSFPQIFASITSDAKRWALPVCWGHPGRTRGRRLRQPQCWSMQPDSWPVRKVPASSAQSRGRANDARQPRHR